MLYSRRRELHREQVHPGADTVSTVVMPMPGERAEDVHKTSLKVVETYS